MIFSTTINTPDNRSNFSEPVVISLQCCISACFALLKKQNIAPVKTPNSYKNKKGDKNNF
jgi:hypothetical protein